MGEAGEGRVLRAAGAVGGGWQAVRPGPPGPDGLPGVHIARERRGVPLRRGNLEGGPRQSVRPGPSRRRKWYSGILGVGAGQQATCGIVGLKVCLVEPSTQHPFFHNLTHNACECLTFEGLVIKLSALGKARVTPSPSIFRNRWPPPCDAAGLRFIVSLLFTRAGCLYFFKNSLYFRLYKQRGYYCCPSKRGRSLV